MRRQTRCFQRLGFSQAEEQISHRRRDGDAVQAVAGRDGIAAGRPVPAGHAETLLERVLQGEADRMAAWRYWPFGLICLGNSAPHRAQFTLQITQLIPFS